MNPWEVDYSQQEVSPWEENYTSEEKRGANLGGALRNIAQSLPVVGTYMDELEGAVRSLPSGLSDYEKYKKNALDSAEGNIENTSYGLPVSIGTNFLGNAGIAAATGGASLMPPVSAAQGAIEGFGRGEGVGERGVHAGIGAGIGFAIPKVLNSFIPTKGVQNRLAQQLVKKGDPLQKIFIESGLKRQSPQKTFSEIGKGFRPGEISKLGQVAKTNRRMANPILQSSAEMYSRPYNEFIAEGIESVAPSYGKLYSEEVDRIISKKLGSDLIGNLNMKEVSNQAINNITKDAPQTVRKSLADAYESLIAERAAAKQLSKTLKEPVKSSGSGVMGRILKGAQEAGERLGSSANYRTLMTPITPALGTEPIRGGVDSILEELIRPGVRN